MTFEEILTLRFEKDSDGTGKLVVSAAANGFSGVGEAYFTDGQILEFADALSAFPLPRAGCPELAGGYYDGGGGRLIQEHVALAVYPVDSRGNIGVQVRTATTLSVDGRPESQHKAQLEIMTSYEPLAKFGRELKALAVGGVEEVTLRGERLT